jgi:capsular polysaccharide transport system permease protein
MTQVQNSDAYTPDAGGSILRRSATQRGRASVGAAAALWNRTRSLRRRSFFYCVLLPTLLAFVYLQFFATRQYVTEFQFTILPLSISGSPNSGGSSASSAGQSPVTSSSSSGGSSALLSVMDNMVTNYITSHQAVLDMQKSIDLKQVFDNDKIDPIQRFWWNNGSFERLTDFWKWFVVSANFDVTTGLCDVQVKASTPQDSVKIARALVLQSENLVNNQSLRQRQDSVKYAQSEFESAQTRLNRALASEQAFRQSHQSIDPSINGTANQTLTASIQQNLATLRAQRDALAKVSPGAPALSLLDSQIQSTEQQLTKVSGNIGGGDVSAGAGTARSPIAASMQEYESIEAEKNFATQNYTANLQNLTASNFAAAQQQFYLEPYVEPVTPQYPTYPQPLAGTLLVFVVVLALWGIGSLFLQAAKSHA